MNRLSFILPAVVVIIAMMSVPNVNLTLANAYSCSSTSSAQNTDTQSGVSGSSGSCSTSSNAATSSKLAGHITTTESGPNISGRLHLAGTSNGLEAAFSLSSGGAQSSCSSGSASKFNWGYTDFNKYIKTKQL